MRGRCLLGPSRPRTLSAWSTCRPVGAGWWAGGLVVHPHLEPRRHAGHGRPCRLASGEQTDQLPAAASRPVGVQVEQELAEAEDRVRVDGVVPLVVPLGHLPVGHLAQRLAACRQCGMWGGANPGRQSFHLCPPLGWASPQFPHSSSSASGCPVRPAPTRPAWGGEPVVAVRVTRSRAGRGASAGRYGQWRISPATAQDGPSPHVLGRASPA